MGLGIIISLKMFDLSTPKIDEWELIKQGNIAMAIVLERFHWGSGAIWAGSVG